MNVISLTVMLFIGGQACSKRAEQRSAEEGKPILPITAAASPSALLPPSPLINTKVVPTPSPSVPTPTASSSSSTPPAGEPGEKKESEKELEPIDLAIAPTGGVPHHPEGTQYKSPFAKPYAKGQAVKVAIMINSIDDYDIKTGKFSADFYMSLTSTEPMPAVDLHGANGILDQKTVLADRPTFKLYRFFGTFKSPADLRKYPFDSQDLKIVLEDDDHGTDQLRLVVDKERTLLARGFRAVGWRVNYIEARSLSFTYGGRFENDDLYYGRYIIRVGLERFAAGSIFKVYIPALVIVLISLLGMWVPPEEMEVRSNTGAPMLAAAVLFHYSLMQELPATSYLMRADKLMLGVYISLLLGMMSTWVMFLVKERRVDDVFRIARIAVPVLTFLIMVAACFF